MNENAKQQCKSTKVVPCENQNESSDIPPFRSSRVFTERSRSSHLVKIAIKLDDSDEESNLVIDVPPQPVSKRSRIRRSCTSGNTGKELPAVIYAEKQCENARADVLQCTEGKSDDTTFQKNTKSLKYKKLAHVSSKANNICLPDVNTDIPNVLEERDTLAYSEEKHVSSAASVEAVVKKQILKQGNAETNTLVKAFVQKHATNEDCVGSRRVSQSVWCTGHLSKNETTTESPYKETITNTNESQSIEGNRGNDNPENRYSHPTYYLNKKVGEITLLSSSAEKIEPSGEDTELSDSGDPLEECRRIFDEFEREAQKGPHKQVRNKKEMVPFKESWKQGHDVGTQQTLWKAVESAVAVGRGQACIYTTSGQNKTASGLSTTLFQGTGPRASLNLHESQPIADRSDQHHERNVGRGMICRVPSSSSVNSRLMPYKVSTGKRPSIPESGSKVPFETRQRYIGLFFTECVKAASTVNEAVARAMKEEQSVYSRCGSKNMYLSIGVNTLKKLRDSEGLSNSQSFHGAVSIKKQEEKVFTGGDLYGLLKSYLLSEEQLKENNFPRPNPGINGSAIFKGIVKRFGNDAFKRMCCRCGEVYAVTSSGEYMRKEECNYHSGRILEEKVPGGVEKSYSCCERIVGSAGCQIAKLHVHDGRREKLEGFMKTLIKSPRHDGNYGVYALNCETCYTTYGMELTRVTVVDAKRQVVYDSFVKPDGKVVDCDKRLSGVTKDVLRETTTSLQSVQAKLLNLFNADTILIGHRLENDLFFLKLIHDKVVDTSVVFPHRLGFPHKIELRSLMADYLRRIHQDDVSGHNSREDALACMDLILWKVKEDNKRRKH
ncbi:exonuclease GOR-like [Tyto alba]|uniref:exonuclease GOR-like n=1 Tax=Tyto alba TaxID=56313 RepID=UPI001C68727D|nr:exonuclease GOR-like [Tyto alba]